MIFVTYPGKLKLILSGFHEAALAAKKIFQDCSDKKSHSVNHMYLGVKKDVGVKLTIRALIID